MFPTGSLTVLCLQTLWVRFPAPSPAATGGIPVRPAPVTPKLLALKLRELLYVLPWTQGTPSELFLCFPSIPHVAPSTLLTPAGHWGCCFIALDQKRAFLELSLLPCNLLHI